MDCSQLTSIGLQIAEFIGHLSSKSVGQTSLEEQRHLAMAVKISQQRLLALTSKVCGTWDDGQRGILAANLNNFCFHLQKLVCISGELERSRYQTKEEASRAAADDAIQKLAQSAVEISKIVDGRFKDREIEAESRLKALQVVLLASLVERWDEPRRQVASWAAQLDRILAEKVFVGIIRSGADTSISDSDSCCFAIIQSIFRDFDALLFLSYAADEEHGEEFRVCSIQNRYSKPSILAPRIHGFYKDPDGHPYLFSESSLIRLFPGYTACGLLAKSRLMLANDLEISVQNLAGQVSMAKSVHSGQALSSGSGEIVFLETEKSELGLRVRFLDSNLGLKATFYPGKIKEVHSACVVGDNCFGVKVTTSSGKEIRLFSRREQVLIPGIQGTLIAGRRSHGRGDIELLLLKDETLTLLKMSPTAKTKTFVPRPLTQLSFPANQAQPDHLAATFDPRDGRLLVVYRRSASETAQLGVADSRLQTLDWRQLDLGRDQLPTGICVLNGIICISTHP